MATMTTSLGQPCRNFFYKNPHQESQIDSNVTTSSKESKNIATTSSFSFNDDRFYPTGGITTTRRILPTSTDTKPHASGVTRTATFGLQQFPHVPSQSRW